MAKKKTFYGVSGYTLTGSNLEFVVSHYVHI